MLLQQIWLKFDVENKDLFALIFHYAQKVKMNKISVKLFLMLIIGSDAFLQPWELNKLYIKQNVLLDI
jgi:hypothetical protein